MSAVLSSRDIETYLVLMRDELLTKNAFIHAKRAFDDAKDKRHAFEERLWPRERALAGGTVVT